jgi:hypothetical protein
MIKELTSGDELRGCFTERVAAEVNAYFERYGLPDRLVLEHFLPFWERMITQRHGHLLAYLDQDGLMQGAFGGAIYPNVYSGQTDAQQVFWHMLPKGKGHGVPLLRGFERLARSGGARRMFIHHPLLDKPQVYRDTFERLGYRPVEVNYTMNLGGT